MPTDPSKLAKSIIDIATGQVAPEPTDPRDPSAIARGRAGGEIGGKARAASLSAKRRREIARKAAGSDKGDEIEQEKTEAPT
jgi:hypothetical protein